jgi:hypothetical protein
MVFHFDGFGDMGTAYHWPLARADPKERSNRVGRIRRDPIRPPASSNTNSDLEDVMTKIVTWFRKAAMASASAPTTRPGAPLHLK